LVTIKLPPVCLYTLPLEFLTPSNTKLPLSRVTTPFHISDPPLIYKLTLSALILSSLPSSIITTLFEDMLSKSLFKDKNDPYPEICKIALLIFRTEDELFAA
jgi:hypothetical protein